MTRILSILVLLLAAPSIAAAAEPSTRTPRARGSSPPLANATPDDVKARLGEPAVANAEGKGAFWTYRLEDCALMVFFKDTGQGLRVSGVQTGPRRRAETPPDAETCIGAAKRTP